MCGLDNSIALVTTLAYGEFVNDLHASDWFTEQIDLYACGSATQPENSKTTTVEEVTFGLEIKRV